LLALLSEKERGAFGWMNVRQILCQQIDPGEEQKAEEDQAQSARQQLTAQQEMAFHFTLVRKLGIEKGQ
jgi:hypothetical protein